MPSSLSPALRSKVIRLLLLQWRPEAIAKTVHCSWRTVYNIQESLLIYGTAYAPSHRPNGRPMKMTKAMEESLLAYLDRYPWAFQSELAWFLQEEWGIGVHRSTISRLMKRSKITKKTGQRIGRQNQELRVQWYADMHGLTAE